MSAREPRGGLRGDAAGSEILALMSQLFPICRSITGAGLRETLGVLKRRLPLVINEVPSGTRVLDWTVPKEWNIRDAYIKGPRGDKVVDFGRSNLHVVSYSVPVRATMPLAELRTHLHTLPEHPDWIPYRTSYYSEDWGFCLRHKDLATWEDGDYEVVIDATLADGSLTYGELVLEGRTKDEVLISAHACHPSLANDNLSGVALAAVLAESLAGQPHELSYRFLFAPGTIGAITWLARNGDKTDGIKAGLVLTGLGDRGRLTYKRSRRGHTAVDRAASLVLGQSIPPGRVLEFSPYGYDERQFCSPGFDLPVGRLSRTPFGDYPEYHTSADDLGFVGAGALGDSYDKTREILDILEQDGTFVNLSPKGEPQLGRRGLYAQPGPEEMALLWVLNMSDGRHSLLDVAERSGLGFGAIRKAADRLAGAKLLRQEKSS